MNKMILVVALMAVGISGAYAQTISGSVSSSTSTYASSSNGGSAHSFASGGGFSFNGMPATYTGTTSVITSGSGFGTATVTNPAGTITNNNGVITNSPVSNFAAPTMQHFSMPSFGGWHR